MCRSSHSRLTHAHRSRSAPSYVSFFTNERYICKLNFDMFVLTINLEWTFTVANQSGNPDTTRIICIYIIHVYDHPCSLTHSFLHTHTTHLKNHLHMNTWKAPAFVRNDCYFDRWRLKCMLYELCVWKNCERWKGEPEG